ncbi:hypothetical protein GIS00_02885 [Nakamurella sp. YIM 132087]|uniref:Uncharacterized protein n=1 Tax=Nakamurella alba TaxID=2665158 RepID=A0A7K1FFJ7_9ACTN|nr:hypothetical protein [Nakamurella alba]MTD12891.1 hypothetical protein [Nakamurella alba]
MITVMVTGPNETLRVLLDSLRNCSDDEDVNSVLSSRTGPLGSSVRGALSAAYYLIGSDPGEVEYVTAGVDADENLVFTVLTPKSIVLAFANLHASDTYRADVISRQSIKAVRVVACPDEIPTPNLIFGQDETLRLVLVSDDGTEVPLPITQRPAYSNNELLRSKLEGLINQLVTGPSHAQP